MLQFPHLGKYGHTDWASEIGLGNRALVRLSDLLPFFRQVYIKKCSARTRQDGLRSGGVHGVSIAADPSSDTA